MSRQFYTFLRTKNVNLEFLSKEFLRSRKPVVRSDELQVSQRCLDLGIECWIQIRAENRVQSSRGRAQAR